MFLRYLRSGFGGKYRIDILPISPYLLDPDPQPPVFWLVMMGPKRIDDKECRWTCHARVAWLWLNVTMMAGYRMLYRYTSTQISVKIGWYIDRIVLYRVHCIAGTTYFPYSLLSVDGDQRKKKNLGTPLNQTHYKLYWTLHQHNIKICKIVCCKRKAVKKK